jgi:hypothetical protein
MLLKKYDSYAKHIIIPPRRTTLCGCAAGPSPKSGALRYEIPAWIKGDDAPYQACEECFRLYCVNCKMPHESHAAPHAKCLFSNTYFRSVFDPRT